ncbi:MAG: ABC transporter substrate-binding protein/permease [Lachnobacterium sp.]|nr:ABC transporter substrate-binding protein/permease [Lachnobacterium sp.]
MNKKQKRWSIFILAILICLSVAGCGKDDDSKPLAVESVEDLAGTTIGVQIGTTGAIYAEDFVAENPGTEVIRYNKGADAVQALKQQKIDAVLIDEQPALAFVEKNNELTIADEEFAMEEYAIGIAKENTELLYQINDALEAIKVNGTMDEIVANYIGDEKGEHPYESPEGLTRGNGTLTMATNVAFPPYEYYEDKTAVGIDIDMMQAIADYLNMDLVVSDMEFDSVIMAVQSGKADVAAAGLTVKEDRLKNISFSESYTTAKQVIIYNNGEKAEKMSLADKIYQTFIEKNRWQYIPKGLANTLLITVFRGTPMVVQLLIMYYVVFAQTAVNPLIAAVIAFGLNSGAYLSEAIRSGIMAIEIGQFEAGRSMGFNYHETVRYIIMPQAIKVSLPAIFNEYIALLKESSIVGYIGLMDLTKAGDIIRSNTYEALVPLVSVALVYLALVMIMTSFVSRLERRLKREK